MGSLLRTYGWPLTSLIVVLVALWIGGMIAAPLLTMGERSLVHVDRGNALGLTRNDINRLSRDIATVDYDIDARKKELADLTKQGGADAAGGSGGGGMLVPGLGVPSVQDRAEEPSASPAAPSAPLLPSFGSAAPDDRTPEALRKEISDLEAKRNSHETQMDALRQKQARLVEEQAGAPHYSLGNYSTIEPLHLKIFLKTILYATLVTAIAFLVCYPVAYYASSLKGALGAGLILLLLVIPYSINELLRVYAWVMILAREGVLNSVLEGLGLVGGEPPQWVASNNAVFLVMAYAYILFMMFPLMNTLGTLDRSQVEAARDLGASVWRVHYRVVLPHAKPGIAMGSIVVFMLSAGVITVPDLVGRGLHPDWFSQVIYRRFFESGNWNQGSAYSLMLLFSCIVFILMVLGVFRVSIREIAR
ncbi:ABC transporter permease [Jiella sonneratiae]|uniref:ABC transporter permease n=1 Tax=Jiella sonneratiae TaxID=2816856 RepID=A0ABS3J8Z8_9HYPH|nr:ABC transporter permease [Jiella sonneratiae]MBO0906147.1 ABC transporter permease [Jiella sonneratiae]